MQGKLGAEREQVALLRQHQEHMEDELRGLKIRNREYEDGVYGLPQVGWAWRGRCREGEEDCSVGAIGRTPAAFAHLTRC